MTDFEKEVLDYLRWRKKNLTRPSSWDWFFIFLVFVMVVCLSLGALGFEPFSVVN